MSSEVPSDGISAIVAVEPLQDEATGLALGVLQSNVIEDPWPPESVAEVLSMPGAFALVARHAAPDDGETAGLAGYVICGRAGDDGEILSIGVDAALRGQGIGRELLNAAVAHLFQSGAEAIFLEVSEDNESALALYRKTGFETVGRRKNYVKRGDGSQGDALIMRLPHPSADQTQI